MSYHIIGTCSECGGAVAVPTLWGSVLPPTPTCTQCGALAASHGPIIKMIKPKPPTIMDLQNLTVSSETNKNFMKFLQDHVIPPHQYRNEKKNYE